MASKLATTCCNIGYDLLTILISIADVTTDIIVLIDFYNKERMTFFIISLIILILAQCSYAMAFTARFDTIGNWDPAPACFAFFCMLPFGTLVAFFMYFASDELGFDGFRDFVRYDLSLDSDSSWFNVRSADSKLVKWIKKKLDKHLGFILEAAIEAFPQSLLQIIAIVYYQEANYVSIVSILLSMLSVISKSLILSQGIDKYTFIWSWLCVVADFFGIFFTLTWVFYAHDLIHGEFLQYFNIFGQIWIYKFAISTLLPVAFALFMFFSVGYWFLYCFMLLDGGYPGNIMERCGWMCLWLTFAPIIAILCAFAACLAMEVFCFSFLALAVYTFGTDRIAQNRSDHTSKLVELMLNFISKGNDKCLRIASINKALNMSNPKKCVKLSKFIDDRLDKEGYDGLKKITYRNMRENCQYPDSASFFVNVYKEWKDAFETQKADACRGSEFSDKFMSCMEFLTFCSLVFWVFPVLLISKLLQGILYPWIIVVYLWWNDLIFSNKIDTLQMVMLVIFIGLQLIIFLLGLHVMKIHWYLWHINPGIEGYWRNVNEGALVKRMLSFYDNACWYPQVEKILFNCFLGSDIGQIIMQYCRSIKLPELYSSEP